MNVRNWAGNYAYRAVRLHEPETVEQVQEIVARSRRVRALGTRHSFNDIADSPEDLVAMAKFDRIAALDRERRTVTVEAGVRYGELSAFLHREGYALPNLASLPHLSVAGACATATHGSGDANGNLATAVVGMEVVTAEGKAVAHSRERDGDTFDGRVVHLGALGIVTQLTLALVPSFDIRQQVYENLPWAQAEAHFDKIASSAYSVSLFTDWQGERLSQVWLKRLASEPAPPAFFQATPARADRHPLAQLPAQHCTPQSGVPGPWHERLPHFRLEFTPSHGDELQSEYFVARADAVAALRAVRELRAMLAPLLLISEIRTIAADALWMSPCYRQASVGIHFTWKPDGPGVRDALPRIEERLAPFSARPHWGKLFAMEPERLQGLYERRADFQRLRRADDPEGKFGNGFLERTLGN